MGKSLLTTILTVLAAVTAMSQTKAPEGFTVIENQPEGNLRIYSRSGNTVKEVSTGESYYLTTGTQDGTMNIVFATDGAVYIQCPVSESYYEGWVKGTLSDDGHSIHVAAGQYTAYTHSFDMAVQVWMMRYDKEADTYVVDEDVSDIVYNFESDGTITLQNTDQQHILGCVNRCFGSTFSYLDWEWHGIGDYASVYTPSDNDAVTPLADLETSVLTATTGYNDGYGWGAYNGKVNLGFDGDDAWLQGISDLMPQAWVKGHRDGNTLTFPTGQMLGSYYGSLLYLVGAKAGEDGNPVLTDIVFTTDGNGTYTSYTDIFISSIKDDISYIIYYMGLTLSDKAEEPIAAPANLLTETYLFTYREPDDYGRLKKQESEVQIGLTPFNEVYIQGITPILPNAFIKGTKNGDGLVTFASPQYLGTYNDEETGDYPIYFQAYNGDTGELYPSITFKYDEATRAFSSPSAVIGIGINKTGILGLQNMYNATFSPTTATAITNTTGNAFEGGEIYNMQGQRVVKAQKGLYIVNGKKQVVK